MSIFFTGINGSQNAARQQKHNDCQRHANVNVNDGFQNHFQTDKSKDGNEGGFEVFKLFHRSGEDKIQGAQAQNGKYIAAKNDKRVFRHRKNGGNGIESEQNIGGFDDDKRKEKGCGGRFSVYFNEKLPIFKGVTEGYEFL